MHAPQPSSLLPHTGSIQLAQPLPAPSRAGNGPGMDSSDLLQGRKSVTILHNGMSYRLQATKLGKLILTK